MSIEIKCNCGSDYRLDDSRAGEQFTCKVCGATMTLPVGVGRASPNAPASAKAPVGALAGAATDATSAESRPTRTASLDHVGEPLPTPEGAEMSRSSQTIAVADSPPPIGTDPMRHTQEQPKLAVEGPRTLPISWCAGRMAMWAVCLGFLFMPWFSMSGKDLQTSATITESITGWQIVMSVFEGARAAAEAGSNGSMPSMTDFTTVPDGAGRVLAGGGMMVFSPLVYLGGLLLVVIIAPLAYSREGRGAVWPFVGCFLGLMGFIIGWHLIAGAAPFKEMLDVASQVGVSIGVSGWAYLMGFVLIIMCLIARSRPDYRLIQAMQWSKENANLGPL